MKNSIKLLLKKLVPQQILLRRRNQLIQKDIEEWQKQGCSLPAPHVVKQSVIKEYQHKFGYSILIETGTFMGEMVEAQKKNFKKIISIELGIDLFKQAQKRFISDSNILIVNGDSGKVLPKILNNIHEPAIFWLDGHYSEGITAKGNKECPIFEELDAILNGKELNHIILVDDARCFVGKGDYPTIDELNNYIKGKNKNYHLEVKYDIIRFVI